jgi:hypothetical protein
MALPTTTQLQKLIDQLVDSWNSGNGREFGASFMDDAHFVRSTERYWRGQKRSDSTTKLHSIDICRTQGSCCPWTGPAPSMSPHCWCLQAVAFRASWAAPSRLQAILFKQWLWC